MTNFFQLEEVLSPTISSTGSWVDFRGGPAGPTEPNLIAIDLIYEWWGTDGLGEVGDPIEADREAFGPHIHAAAASTATTPAGEVCGLPGIRRNGLRR